MSPQAPNITLEISFLHRSPSPAWVGALRTASSQPTSDSEHRACSLPVMGFGVVPRILPGSRLLTDNPAPAEKSSNYGPENTAEGLTRGIWAATLPPPHLQPHTVSPLHLPAPKETSRAVICHLRNLAAKT